MAKRFTHAEKVAITRRALQQRRSALIDLVNGMKDWKKFLSK